MEIENPFNHCMCGVNCVLCNRLTLCSIINHLSTIFMFQLSTVLSFTSITHKHRIGVLSSKVVDNFRMISRDLHDSLNSRSNLRLAHICSMFTDFKISSQWTRRLEWSCRWRLKTTFDRATRFMIEKYFVIFGELRWDMSMIYVEMTQLTRLIS